MELKKSISSTKGFTLIELMMTMLIFGVVISAVYSANLSQQNTYRAQEQVADMQQNLRAALMILISEIRMAGYDPTGAAGAGITTASQGQLSFSSDLDGSGVLGDSSYELLDIGFSTTVDNDRDGLPDLVASLGRQSNGAGGYQPIADNIQAIEFQYLDVSGTVTAVLGDIRSIQITILARAGKTDRNFVNSATYATPAAQTWGPYNDNYRRRMLTTTIRCRNL